MSDLELLIDSVLSHSADVGRRNRLRDELIAVGRWDWATVHRYVLDHPESDGPRLLAADWLFDDEQWQRAEFIRVQCRLALLTDVMGAEATSHPDVARLLASGHRLALDLHGDLMDGLISPDQATWGVPAGDHLRMSGSGVAVDYVRGFAGRIELTTALFLKSAGGLFESQPITAVRLTDKTPVKVAEGWWWGDTCLAPSDPVSLSRCIPPQIYRPLIRGAGIRRRLEILPAELTYPTVEAAREALSSACVAYGRSLAGLPTL